MIRPVFNPLWSEQVRALYTHDMEQHWDRSLSVHQWNQYQSQLATYLDLAPESKRLEILDVGCAQATLALLLAERGHAVTAVDIRQESLDYAASRYESGDITFLCGNVLEMQIEQKFDLIFANQIVEHLVYPGRLISGLRELLNDNGRVVVTTPNWHYMVNQLPTHTQLGDPDQWQHKQFTADGEDHFFAYTADELTSIFEQAGLKNVVSQTYETPFISGHLKFRYAHKFFPYRMLATLDRACLSIPWLGSRLSHQLMVSGTL